MRQVSRSLGGASYILLAASLWGTTATARTFAPASARPVAVGAARVIGGGLLLLPRGAARRHAAPSRHPRDAAPGACSPSARRLPPCTKRPSSPPRPAPASPSGRSSPSARRRSSPGSCPWRRAADPARGPLAGRDGGRRNGLRHARHQRACIQSQRGGRRSGAARQPLLRGVRRHRLVPDHQRRRRPRRCRRHLWRRGRPAPAGPVHQPHELGGDRPGAWRSPPTSPCSPPRWPTSCTPGGCAPPR